MHLYFKLFCLTVFGDCLVLITQHGVQNGCHIIICLTVCFSDSIMCLLKQIIFHNSLVEKSNKDIYVTRNDNSEVQNILFHKKVKGQMSGNFSIIVQFITLE